MSMLEDEVIQDAAELERLVSEIERLSKLAARPRLMMPTPERTVIPDRKVYLLGQPPKDPN